MKTLYFDVETTGLDPVKNGIIQLAIIIDIDGQPVTARNYLIKPFKNDAIDDAALAVNGFTREQIEGFESPLEVYKQLTRLLSKHVNKYKRDDKLWPAGYNCTFDLNFLNQFFIKNGDKYFGSWQNWNAIDPLPIVRRLAWQGIIPMLENFKLATVCEHFDIPLGDAAHDAIADIRATRELNLKLARLYENRG